MRCLLLLLAIGLPLAAAEIQAGFGRIVITPKTPIRMSGYAGRTSPSQGVLHDLWAKALAIRDPQGNRAVIVTYDLSTVPRALAEEVAAVVTKKHGLSRDRLLINCSHTHAGPVIRENAYTLAGAGDEQARVVAEYTAWFRQALVEVIDQALAGLRPARLHFARGEARIGGNRRQKTETGYRIGVNPNGPSDPDVPVVRVTTPDGKMLGVLFGYACHNTTLTAKNLMIAGDYAGFAQIEIEKRHPGATAMFLALCGADQNPQPRETVEHAQEHGKTLAGAVEQALASKLRAVGSPVRAAFETAQLGFAPHTRGMFEARVNDENVWKARHARRMLDMYDKGTVAGSLPYPVQVLRFGRDLTLVALGGEVVVDYALRAKRDFTGEPVIVAGYSNDVMCYIPSLRVLKEGGYEAGDAMIYDNLPGPFDERVEESVFDAVRAGLRKVGWKLK